MMLIAILAALIALIVALRTAPTYQHGKSCPASWTPTGGTEDVLAVTSHDWQESIEKAMANDTSAGGIQQIIAGFLGGTARVRGFIDLANKYYSSTSLIRAGQNGVLKHYVSSSLFFSIPVMITQVNSVVPAGNLVEYDVTMELNGLAGSYTFPS